MHRSLKSAVSILFILTLLAFATQRFMLAWEASSEAPTDTWQASNYWVQSAHCAKEYGILLVGCDNGVIVPFADISLADDTGHALLLGVFEMATGADVQLSDAARLNVIINYTGIVLVTGLLLQVGLRWGAAIVFGGLSLYAGAYIGVAPHPAQLGGSLLAACLPISILCLPKAGVPSPAYWLWISLSAAALGLSLLLRQSVGTMGVIASFVAIAVFAWPRRSSLSKMAAAALLAVLVGLAVLTPTLTLRARDAIWDVPAAKKIESHGIWHNVFIGLGVIDNKFGIEWSDASGADRVQQIDPSVAYVSEKYYQILKDEYFNTIKSAPFDVASIYIRKLGMVLQQHLAKPLIPLLPWSLSLLLVVILTIVSSRFNDENLRAQTFHARKELQFISALFVCAFVIQGVLVHPSTQYLFPVGAFLVIVASSDIERLISALAEAGRRLAVYAINERNSLG